MTVLTKYSLKVIDGLAHGCDNSITNALGYCILALSHLYKFSEMIRYLPITHDCILFPTIHHAIRFPLSVRGTFFHLLLHRSFHKSRSPSSRCQMGLTYLISDWWGMEPLMFGSQHRKAAIKWLIFCIYIQMCLIAGKLRQLPGQHVLK